MQVSWEKPSDVLADLRSQGYLADTALSTAVYLSAKMNVPLFLEGEPGVGKTALALSVANAVHRPLIRLQCYEGIDRESALYDWNYPRQLMHVRLAESFGRAASADLEDELYSERFLIARPLLQAIMPKGPAPVLLIDEIDRSDDEFEAFLLEVLSEFQVTIPEIGSIRAKESPLVFLTSNRTREVHEALKRRCLYQWLGYPSFERELAIVSQVSQTLSGTLAQSLVRLVQRLRQEPLHKAPGVAETLNWARAVEILSTTRLSIDSVEETLGCVLKYHEDIERLLASGTGSATKLQRILTEIGIVDESHPV